MNTCEWVAEVLILNEIGARECGLGIRANGEAGALSESGFQIGKKLGTPRQFS